MTYALIVNGKEVVGETGWVAAKEGERFWVLIEPEGWVEATSIKVDSNILEGKLPKDLKTFETEKAAAAFAKRWKGHPWWCAPNGVFEIVRVERKYKQVPDGYALETSAEACQHPMNLVNYHGAVSGEEGHFRCTVCNRTFFYSPHDARVWKYIQEGLRAAAECASASKIETKL